MSVIIINPFRFAAAGGGGTLTSPSTITIDHTKCGSSDTTNFVFPFSITDANLKSVANGGLVANANHIRFASDSGGSTLLKWKIVAYDATTGTVSALIKIGTLSHTTDTVLYLLFNDNGITTFQGDIAGTFHSAHKIAIDGGDGTTLDITDSTSNANNGANNGAAIAAAGPSGFGAISFTAASSQYITTASTLNIGTVTMEGWFYLAAYPGSQGSLMGFVSPNNSGTADKDVTISSAGIVKFYIYDGGQQFISSTGALGTGAWHYIVVTHDGTLRMYIDGVAAATPSGGHGLSFTGYGAPGFQINGSYQPGGGAGNSTYMTDLSSMVRVLNTAKSADEILATYNAVSAPSTFRAVV